MWKNCLKIGLFLNPSSSRLLSLLGAVITEIILNYEAIYNSISMSSAIL
jgi:hypothetical protein